MKRVACAALLALAVTGCSQGTPKQSTRPIAAVSPAAVVAPPTRVSYERTLLADHPGGLWTLQDIGGSTARDLTVHHEDGQVVEGRIETTDGPGGGTAARFVGTGRIVTPLVGVLRPGRPFTLEFAFRADDCSRQWTQVLGTASYTGRGRQGVNVLHYPRFLPTGCHVAVEFWKDDHYTGGCGSASVARTGVWVHFAAAYDGRTVSCYTDGRRVGSSPVKSFGFAPDSAFGIGGAGSGYAGTLDSGSLSDVAVYPRAVPGTTLQRHARALASAQRSARLGPVAPSVPAIR
jgi:hypothetical protein